MDETAEFDTKLRAQSGPVVGFEEWLGLLGAFKGRYSLKGVEPSNFSGSVEQQSICGVDAVNLAYSVCPLDGEYKVRVDRTTRDARVDCWENFYAVLQTSGQSKVGQGDQVVDLGAGDIALIDSTLPVTYLVDGHEGQWLSLVLPRKSFISILGAEPRRCASGQVATPARQLLFRLVVEAMSNPEPGLVSAEPYLRLAVYDLVGALFVASDLPAVTPHSDKIFKRVSGILQDSFRDPDLSPTRVAEEAGISLRYLQKLFTARGTTFCHWLYGLRLDYAARLLRNRASLKTGQSLSVIAYASGFRDYSHFARAFRRRFGHHPGRN